MQRDELKQRHELNIPTIYSHSIFVEENKKQILLNKKEFDYFWAIIYLYRYKLLDKKPTGFISIEENEKKRSKLNPNTVWDDIKIKIKFSEIQKVIHGKNNGDQKGLKKFIDLFENLQLKTNIFGKASNEINKIVKPVKQISKTSKHIDLILESDFIIPLLITDVLFKKVTLNFMFNLPTNKSKALYLLFKDYDNFHKNFTIEEIEKVVGVIFNNKRSEQIFEYIRTITDIDVVIEESLFLENTFKCIVNSQQKFINYAEELKFYTKDLIVKVAEDKMEQAIATGSLIKSKNAYKEKLVKQILKDENEYPKFEAMASIDIFIREKKEEFISNINKQIRGYWYVCIMIDVNNEIKSYVVNNDYYIREAIFPTLISKSADDTYTNIQNKIECNIYYSDNELINCSKSLIEIT